MTTFATAPEKVLTPDRIFETGMGFMATKTLLAAIKLELFTLLGENAVPGAAIGERLQLHPRSLYDFLDALVALGFLHRDGLGEGALYENTEETALFLDKKKPSYVGGILEMANDRLYKFWSDLEEGLRTGKPQNEIKYTGKPTFEAIYANPAVLRQFLDAMAGIQAGTFAVLAQAFDFDNYDSLCDVGGANALLAVTVARQHPNLRITSVDLPPVEPIAREHVAQAGLADRITVASLDMMSQPFPKADVITMGNILHDWDEAEKKHLIRKAYEALPAGGALVAIENVIDDERRQNAFGLLISLNMLIETPGGFDYTHADFHRWALGAGFRATTKISLAGAASAVIAHK
jgi:2-polyprenyl-3-methyl-5-hydroxy-6-metoxy-1,4-benzoquinol methylase